MTYKKLLSIAWILTILSLPTIGPHKTLLANEGVRSGYFYSSSYEGFAGYCTIITPEITEASISVKNRLQINSTKPLFKFEQDQNNQYSPQKKQSKKQPKNNNKSFSDIANQFAANIERR